MGVNALEPEFWIAMVGRVATDPAHLVSATRCRLLLAADRSRIEGDQLAVLAERADILRQFVDLEPGHHAAGRLPRAEVRHRDRSSGLIEVHSRIETLQHFRIDVELLGEELERARVGEVRQPRHLFQIAWDPPHEWPFCILLGDLVFGDYGRVRPPGQLVPGFLVELAGRLPAVRLLKCGNRFAHVLAVLGVDQSRRNGGPVEQNLCLEHHGFGRSSRAGEYWALLTASAESGGGAGARFLASETAGKIAPLASTV